MQLRPYQIDAVNSVFDYYLSGKTGNVIAALPTGTGKSLVVAAIVKRALFEFPGTRVLMLTHVKELIEQNYAKLKELWSSAPVGIYSASVGVKQMGYPVMYGGVQSLRGKADMLGEVNILVIDECHLVSHKDETVYVQLINDLLIRNPNMRVIGLTATPYRLGLGLLTEGGIFDDICFDLTSRHTFNKLLDDGFISPLVPRTTRTLASAEGVATRGGEFVRGDLEKAVDKDEITAAAVLEIIEQGHNRNHCLVFAAGLKHAEHIVQQFEANNVPATMVDGEMTSKEREKRLEMFKSGEVWAMVNNGVLTTGFDFPGIDLIAMLRPTKSPGLWVQMLGRGVRPFPGKENCMVLDFARNTERLGPINDPVLPKQSGGDGTGVAPIRLCEQCGTYCHASIRNCPICGCEFPERLDKWTTQASEAALIAPSLPELVDFAVTRCTYTTHRKEGMPPSMKVAYHCGLRTFHEYVCFEHTGFALKKAHQWWLKRSKSVAPTTVVDALEMSSLLPIPRTIKVWLNKKYPEIMNAEI